MTASNVHASATLALVPTNLSSGQTYDPASHTLTLPAGSAQTFSYDVVVTISGTTPTVSRIQGAVVTSSSGTVVGGQNAYTVGAQYNETTGTFTGTNAAVGHTDAVFNLTAASTAGQAFGTKYTFKPGYATSSSSNISGVGPQSGTFSSLVNTAGSASASRAQVTYATPVAGASLDALTASITLTGNAGNTATLSWADGTGSTSTTPGAGTVYQAALEWAENGSSFFSGVSGSYSQFGLNIVFANAQTYVKGDFGGNPSSDGAFNSPDGFFDGFDIDAFLLANANPDAYLALNPTLTSNDLLLRGDFGGNPSLDGNFNAPDGFFDGFDIDAFLFANADPDGYAAVQPHGAPAPASFSVSVPEAGSTLAMGTASAAGLLARRRRRA